jgi:hypothetical protein
MYRLKDEARKNWEPIPGVPWDGEPIPDERFAEISDEYDKQFPDAPGSLTAWFDHTDDDKRAKKSKGGDD